MDLEVSIFPDSERLREIEEERWDSPPARACGKPLPEPTFRCTGMTSVEAWVYTNETWINSGMGPHWYFLRIKSPGQKPVDWEMPRGAMLLKNRLWRVIEMHEAFYTD